MWAKAAFPQPAASARRAAADLPAGLRAADHPLRADRTEADLHSAGASAQVPAAAVTHRVAANGAEAVEESAWPQAALEVPEA